MKVICISGKAQHGKDTSALMVKEMLEDDGYKVLIAHYGDLVKYICRTFFQWNGEKDEAGRSLLQRIGTDAVGELCTDGTVLPHRPLCPLEAAAGEGEEDRTECQCRTQSLFSI